MNTVETISRGVAWSTLSTVVLKLLSIGSLLVILRELTLYQYGQVELTLASITTIALVTLPAIASVALADIAVELGKHNIARAKGLYLAFIRLHVGLGMVVSIAVALFVYFFGTLLFGQQPVALFLAALVLVFTGTTRNCVTTTLQLNLAYGTSALFSIVEECVKLLALLFLVLVLHIGAHSVIFAIIISQILSQALFMPRIIRFFRSWGHEDPEAISAFAFLTAHARWSIVGGYAGTISQTMRPWLVKLFFGTEAVAIFALSWGLVSQLTGLIPIASVLTPLLPRALAEPERFRLLLEKGMRYQALAYIIAAVAAFFAFPVLVALLFPKYVVALPLFKVLLLITIPSGLDLFTPVFLTLKAQRSMFLATLLKILLTGIGMAVGGWLGGIFGMAFGLVVAISLYTFERYRRLTLLIPDFRLRMRDFVTIDEYDAVLFAIFKRQILRLFV